MEKRLVCVILIRYIFEMDLHIMRNLAIEEEIARKISAHPHCWDEYTELEYFVEGGDLRKFVTVYVNLLDKDIPVSFTETEHVYVINTFDTADAIEYFTRVQNRFAIEFIEKYLDKGERVGRLSI